jgi:hypothetical protein
MVRHPIRTALLLVALTVVAVAPARAADATPQATGPTMRTITVTECVPETYQKKITCYRTECKTETYDTFRCETVCEPRERVCTVVKRIPVMKTETRKVCTTQVCYEDRVVMKKCYENQRVTCMVKKCVSRGHWECKEVCKNPGFFERLCNPCACPHTTTRKVWVHCPVYQECPVTKCKKVCVQKPVHCKVKVCKQVWKDVQVQVCTYRCEEQKVVQKYNVMVTKKVPVKATRTVRVCVPYEKTVTCTRMVQRQVQRQVPCEVTCCKPACQPCKARCKPCKPCRSACKPCRTSCRNSCCDSCKPWRNFCGRNRCNSCCH